MWNEKPQDPDVQFQNQNLTAPGHMARALILNNVRSMYVIKIKHHILLALLLSFSGTAFSQTRAETIPWSADRKLQWSDFKGSYLKTQWAAAT
ncbi:MAG TPA: hypothetical protein VFM69_03090, partial [Pricia sp.]|nr:hypothetical protein [Pricia sp.]